MMITLGTNATTITPLSNGVINHHNNEENSTNDALASLAPPPPPNHHPASILTMNEDSSSSSSSSTWSNFSSNTCATTTSTSTSASVSALGAGVGGGKVNNKPMMRNRQYPIRAANVVAASQSQTQQQKQPHDILRTPTKGGASFPPTATSSDSSIATITPSPSSLQQPLAACKSTSLLTKAASEETSSQHSNMSIKVTILFI